MQPLFEGGIYSKKYGICMAWSSCTSIRLSLVSEYATSRRSHASSSVKSPIESSLDFPQSKMEGFQRFTGIIDSKNPCVSRRSEEKMKTMCQSSVAHLRKLVMAVKQQVGHRRKLLVGIPLRELVLHWANRPGNWKSREQEMGWEWETGMGICAKSCTNSQLSSS